MINIRNFKTVEKKDPAAGGCIAVFTAAVSCPEGRLVLPSIHLFKGSKGFFVKPPSKPVKDKFIPLYYLDGEMRRGICTAVLPVLKKSVQE